jgi:DNA-binding IclR family transcriptional regulator
MATHVVESADRVLRILESFGPREPDVSLGELASASVFPRALYIASS